MRNNNIEEIDNLIIERNVDPQKFGSDKKSQTNNHLRSEIKNQFVDARIKLNFNYKKE
jgi:hypothetical protein